MGLLQEDTHTHTVGLLQGYTHTHSGTTPNVYTHTHSGTVSKVYSCLKASSSVYTLHTAITRVILVLEQNMRFGCAWMHCLSNHLLNNMYIICDLHVSHIHGHMSRVTCFVYLCHMCVTCSQSYVACAPHAHSHMSHVCHMLTVTCHMYVTYSQSHVTCVSHAHSHMSHVCDMLQALQS